jgi:signal transduction histidine kinase
VKQAALHGMAKQVAHDIRSPLTALELVTTDLAVLPEDIRLIIRNAAQRIKAIANDLLRLSKDTEKPASPQNAAEAKLLPLLLESMMGEKLPRLKGQGCSQLIFTVEPGDNALFVHLPEVPFLRALSNLIDNALDATPQGGTVTMNLSRSGAQALIAITDEGNGIPPEVLNVLGKQPISFGKENGNGLGFFSAHKTIIELGGRIDVASSPCGSTVFITLPIVAAPRWISQKLQVRRGATVVVVDDDPSIHDVWASRFAGAVDLHHYMNATALKGTFSSFNNAA